MAEADAGSGALNRLLATISARLARAGRLGAGAAEPAAPADELAYVLSNPTEEAKPRTLVGMLGEPSDNVAEVIESVATACRLRGEYPVALMSSLRPDVIAASTVPIEFMPTHAHLSFDAATYERYVRRRWALMSAKWKFVRQVELGMSFDDFLEQQLGRARG